MHFLLGLLGVAVTVAILLKRLADAGIDLGGLNPFLRRRSAAWRNRYESNPLFQLDDPMDIAAVLVVGVAKIDGDLSADEKRAIVAEFRAVFEVDEKRAAELLGGSAHMLADISVLDDHLDAIIVGRDGLFSAERARMLADMMQRIAALGGGATERQREFIARVRDSVAPKKLPDGGWQPK